MAGAKAKATADREVLREAVELAAATPSWQPTY